MAKGFEIAEGYLDISADVDGALADVRRFFKEVDGELDASEKKFKKSGEQSGKEFVEAIERTTKRNGGLLSRVLGGSGGRDRINVRSILGGLTAGLRRARSAIGGAFSGLFSGGTKAFKSITEGIIDAFKLGVDGAKQIWENASKLFQQASNIGGGVGGIAMFGLIGTAIPAAIGLAGAVAQLSAALLALPAAIGVAGAALGTLMLAFKGFGEAVGAGLSGNVDKFNEALKKLSPSARRVAKEFVALGPALKGIQQAAQEGFFAQLVGQFQKLSPLLATVNRGMFLVGGALGHIVKSFIDLLSQADTINTINNLFGTTTRILDDLREPLINLFGGLFDLINASLPYVERFAHVFGNGLQTAADWLQRISSDGTLTAWLERAWKIGGELWRLLKELGVFAGTLLGSFGDEGTDTLTGMADAIAKVNEYLKSKDGQETLHNLGVLIHWAGNALVFLINNTVRAYQALNAFFSFVRGIGPFFAKVWNGIVSGAKAVGGWFVWLWDTVSGGVSTAWSAVGRFFTSIGQWFVDAYHSVIDWGGKVVAWFVALPGVIGAWLSQVPGKIVNLWMNLYNATLYGIGYLAGLLVRFWTTDLPGWIRDGWNWVAEATKTAVAWLISTISALPGQIWDGLQALWGYISDAFSTAWNAAYDWTASTIERIQGFVKALPGWISSHLSALGESIGGWFSRAWDRAQAATIAGYISVLMWVKGIPGAIGRALSGAADWLYETGKDILRGLVKGAEAMTDWAIGRAKAVAKRVADAFKDAFKISSPSKLMADEVGRWLLPGVMVGVEKSRPQFEDYLGSTADMIAGGYRPTVNVAAPSVSVGGTTLIADLGDGVRQVVQATIIRSPRIVASATNVGNRQRAGWVNTGRPAVTGV